MKELSIPERNLGNLDKVSTGTHDMMKVFKEQEIISESDLKAFSNAKEFAISAFVDTPQYRPMVIKLASVLSDGQFPTADAKFWQCKAEAEVHFNELIRNIYKIESMKIDLEELDYKILTLHTMINHDEAGSKLQVFDPNFDINLTKIQMKRLLNTRQSVEFELKLMEKNTKYRMEEVSDWCSIASKLEAECQYDVHNKNDSSTKTLFKRLEFEIARAGDEKTKKNYTDQLNTLKRLLFEKAKANI